MDYIIKKNEAEINENVAKGLLCIFGFYCRKVRVR